MRIEIKEYTPNKITYLIEREKGIYNNVLETVNLTDEEIEGLSEDEIKTLGYVKQAKKTAIKVFEQIEPLCEEDNPVGFELVPSRPVRIKIYGTNTLQIGDNFEHNATVYDQYNKPMDAEITWTNKVVEAKEVGTITVIASIGDITNALDVNIIERVKTKEEKQQELNAKLLKDSASLQIELNKQKQLNSDLLLKIAQLGGN